jgi:hypothetical protein
MLVVTARVILGAGHTGRDERRQRGSADQRKDIPTTELVRVERCVRGRLVRWGHAHPPSI